MFYIEVNVSVSIDIIQIVAEMNEYFVLGVDKN